jgi:SAM-dependent methyltransferase
MRKKFMMYQKLCTEFYDLDKKFADQDEIDFYKQFLNKDDLILEPMCGSGRLLIPLLQEGYSVHGLDNSSAMLNSCKNRAAQFNFYPNLYEGNIENLLLLEKYNTILIPLGSFQLLYPRALAFKALENLKKHLLPSGKLILDLFVPWDALYENNEKEVREREVFGPNDVKINLQSESFANKHEQYIFSKSIYSKFTNNQMIATENEEMTLCWYYRYEMELILEKYGYKNIIFQEIYFRNEAHMIFMGNNNA